MNIGQEYTYWEFIKEHGVVIPLIQRDYAQGREGKEDLRKRFLGDLKSALDTPKPIVLDFVYGVKDDDNHIIPLDGQQRLTTLWLLHWYIFLKSERNAMKDTLDVFRSFTYQTRISSRSFCEALCDHDHFIELRDSQKIREDIVGQTWFMSEWEQDPTVKAMLNMLGGKEQSIETVFCGCNKDKFLSYWKALIGTVDKCPIVFYYLPIDGEVLQNPDDIYIKMNARGEHLTDFENFKADLIKHVGENKGAWACFDEQHPELALSKLIDDDWTNVFWNDLENKACVDPLPSVDKQFFAFLNRFFLNRILKEISLSEKEMNTFGTEDFKYDNDSKETKQLRLFFYLYSNKEAEVGLSGYRDFQIYKDAEVITSDAFQDLKQVFQGLTELLKGQKYVEKRRNVFRSTWGSNNADENGKNEDKQFYFLPRLSDGKDSDSESVIPITQPQRVVFYGICCYLESGEYNDGSFKEWMRFVWNMAENSDVQNIQNMKEAILKIDRVKAYSHSIIDYLKAAAEEGGDSYLSRQWNEEICKAKIYDVKQKDIVSAEEKFKGSIRFLLTDDNRFLEHTYITKAQALINPADKDDYQWLLEILKYIPHDALDKTKSLEFKVKTGDKIKAVNRFEYIGKAIRSYLDSCSSPSPCATAETKTPDWVDTLLALGSKDSNWKMLMEYSSSKKVQKYFMSDPQTGIYLYKGGVWKKDDCILLASVDGDIQDKIKKRNGFIKHMLENEGWVLCFDDARLEQSKISPDNDYKHYGRTIVLEKGDQFLYCGVGKYYDKNGVLGDYLIP